DMLLARLERHAVRHRTAGQRPVALETEVVVEPPRVMALYHEDWSLAPALAPEGLRRLLGISLLAVLGELRHAASLPCATAFGSGNASSRLLDRLAQGRHQVDDLSPARRPPKTAGRLACVTTRKSPRYKASPPNGGLGSRPASSRPRHG